MSGRWRRLLPHIAFVLTMLVPTALLLSLIQSGTQPIDYEPYERAAIALRDGAELYPSAVDTRRIWSSMHDAEAAVLERDAGELEPIAGPYLYPPTLASLIAELNVGATGFVVMVLLSTIGFALTWVQIADRRARWLLLVVGSWSVLASFLGANVELVLVFLMLVASWLLWHGHRVLPAPLVALIVLVKPFYALGFVTLGLVAASRANADFVQTLRRWSIAAGITVLLIAAEMYRWGPALRADFFDYLADAVDHLWLVMPVSEQTPMSIWNRTPLQGLVVAGVPVESARVYALALWLLPVLLTIWWVRRTPIEFPLAFGLTLVLFYWGRPIAWTHPYLELVVVSLLWSVTERWQRLLLAIATLVLMLSHWAALWSTVAGNDLRLFTLQSATSPWETWTVVPVAWLLLMWRARRESGSG